MVKEKNIKGKLEITPTREMQQISHFTQPRKRKKIFKLYFLSNNKTQKNEKICIFLVIQGKSFILILYQLYVGIMTVKVKFCIMCHR